MDEDSVNRPDLVEALIPQEGGVMPAPRKYRRSCGSERYGSCARPGEQDPELSLNVAVNAGRGLLVGRRCAAPSYDGEKLEK